MEHHFFGRRLLATFIIILVAVTIMLILLCYFHWQLSMWRCNDELRVRADELLRSSKKDAKHYIGNLLNYGRGSFSSVASNIKPQFHSQKIGI